MLNLDSVIFSMFGYNVTVFNEEDILTFLAKNKTTNKLSAEKYERDNLISKLS